MKILFFNKYVFTSWIAVIISIVVTTDVLGQDARDFTLKGHITGIPDGQQVYLTLHRDAENPVKARDSTRIKKGQFTFSGRLDYPELYTIIIKKPGASLANHSAQERFDYVFPIFLTHGNLKLKTDAKPNMTYLEYGITEKYPYEEVKVEGSAFHATYMDFLMGYKPFKDSRSSAFNRYIKFLNSKEKTALGHIEKGVSLVDSIDLASEAAKKYVFDFINKQGSDPVGLYITRQYYLGGATASEIADFLKRMPQNIAETALGKALITYANKAKQTAVGSTFIDFEFKDHQDKAVRLSDKVGKGKYVLLEFWASWCGPCRSDIPHIKEVYDRYHPAGFEIISISMDDKKEQWLRALEQEQMSWLQVSDLKAFGGQLSDIYRFNGIPFCVLIDPQGKILTRNMRGSWMDRWLIKLYGNRFENNG